MARPKKIASSSPSFSPSHAVHILERALAERKLSKADLSRYAAEMHEEISHLESRLASLKDAVVGAGKRIGHAIEKKLKGGDGPFPHTEKVSRKKKRKPISAERKASMQLQGQYLSLFAKLPKKDRATYKSLAKKEGREKAIAEMKKAIGK